MKTPWHLWIVGLATLLWNAMGAFDYFMTQTKNADYLTQFTPEQLTYFQSFPVWVQGSWAVAVWFGVAGSVLLLFRTRWAAPVLGLSFFAMMVTSFHNFVLAEVKMQEVVGAEAIYFSAFIFVIALVLWLYALKMRANGVLR
uniref:hypothetical protein n=1 Tax=Pararhizobium sp. IMCC3301 TaxID=3067904 RepID=UPI0027408DF5|nr:hypothetical protein [Pararhizobium sp. IMCC3301]